MLWKPSCIAAIVGNISEGFSIVLETSLIVIARRGLNITDLLGNLAGCLDGQLSKRLAFRRGCSPSAPLNK